MKGSSVTLMVISSMATRALLAELLQAYEAQADIRVALESVGGVDAYNRVRAGEPFDVVVLARDALDKLSAGERLHKSSAIDLVRSPIAIAVRSGTPQPDVHTEDAVKQAVLSARSVGISTGPSGTELSRLFERWGIAEQIAERVVTASPGVAVGSLVARGEVELGFQQHSELLGLGGVDILGLLPAPIQILTTFSAALTTASRAAATGLVAFLASPDAAEAKRRHGMQPA